MSRIKRNWAATPQIAITISSRPIAERIKLSTSFTSIVAIGWWWTRWWRWERRRVVRQTFPNIQFHVDGGRTRRPPLPASGGQYLIIGQNGGSRIWDEREHCCAAALPSSKLSCLIRLVYWNSYYSLQHIYIYLFYFILFFSPLHRRQWHHRRATVSTCRHRLSYVVLSLPSFFIILPFFSLSFLDALDIVERKTKQKENTFYF